MRRFPLVSLLALVLAMAGALSCRDAADRSTGLVESVSPGRLVSAAAHGPAISGWTTVEQSIPYVNQNSCNNGCLNTVAREVEARCPEGTRALGGGQRIALTNSSDDDLMPPGFLWLRFSEPSADGRGWRARWNLMKENYSDRTLTAFAVCAAVKE